MKYSLYLRSLTNNVILFGKLRFAVFNCSQASVQLTSSTLRVKVDADCGSLESQDSKTNKVKSIKIKLKSAFISVCFPLDNPNF